MAFKKNYKTVELSLTNGGDAVGLDVPAILGQPAKTVIYNWEVAGVNQDADATYNTLKPAIRPHEDRCDETVFITDPDGKVFTVGTSLDNGNGMGQMNGKEKEFDSGGIDITHVLVTPAGIQGSPKVLLVHLIA